MLFNSLEYLIFLPLIVIAIDIIRSKDYQAAILLIASYFFYFYSAGNFIFIMGLITLVTYLAGKKISVASSNRYKKIWLFVSVAFSLLILGYFKYYRFIVDNLNPIFSQNLPLIEVILPIGISFYTFEAISYVVDIYRGTSPPAKSLKIYALYIAFFPHLVAGPIVISRELLPQIGKKLTVIPENISYGALRISWGLFKKMVIADNLAPIVGAVFNAPTGHSSTDIIIATIIFGIQIYCDFSGYCDIALGSARIIGIKLPENFQSPYLSSNPSEFWRRWNITLGRFIRNYIYIPLGGNRKGSFRTHCNLIIAMLLCGLWHGPAWNFVLWGGYHGACLTGNKFMQRFAFLGKLRESESYWIISILITQYLMFMGWIFFRVSGFDNIVYCIKKFVFIDLFMTSPLLYLGISAVVLIGVLLISEKFTLKGIVERYVVKDYFEIMKMKTHRVQIMILLTLAILIYLLAPAVTSTFIYFQF
jgi:alginate O-acetyltransferase complex protein AlgI